MGHYCFYLEKVDHLKAGREMADEIATEVLIIEDEVLIAVNPEELVEASNIR
jgi:hypothetical protein